MKTGPLPGGYTIGKSPVTGWQAKFDQTYKLSYRLPSGNDLKFVYTLDFVPLYGFDLEPMLVPVHVPTDFLDIDIFADCRIVFEIGQNMFWPTTRDAIFTDENLESHYFALEYETPSGWVERSQLPSTARCTAIRFGAKHDHNNSIDEPSKKFSLNIELAYDAHTSLPMTLDPDIRNPGQS